MKKAFITGATGFIGRELCEELIKHDYKIIALKRKGRDTKELETLGVEFVEGDLLDNESLKFGVTGADSVFHLAALYREAKFPNEMYWKVNCEATKNLLQISIDKGVKKFFHCSTTGVLGHIANPPADENYPYGPLDEYQESKTEAEKHVLQVLSSRIIGGAVIRPTMVWGPRDTRLFKMFKGVKTRRMPIIGDGNTWCHWVLAKDVARAFRLADQTDISNGQLYIAGGEKPVSLNETLEKIAEYYKVKLLPFKIPALPVQLLGSCVEKICKPFGIEPPIHRRRVDFFVKNRSFDCSKIKKELGYKPTCSFDEELKLTAQWYLDNGWL